MRNILMSALVLALVAFGPSLGSTAFGQTRTCSLLLDVVWTNDNFEAKHVTGARAVAVKAGSPRTVQAVFLYGQPKFSRLTDGEYLITVTKPGFKRAVQALNFECLRKNGEAETQIDLVRGSSRQRVMTASRLVKAGGVTTISSRDPAETTGVEAKTAPSALSRRPISGGVLNGKALTLPKPLYPPIAWDARASGTVTIQVIIDEEGNVISASAISGHRLLREAAVQAARHAKFSPTVLSGQPVKVSGVITYPFVDPR